MGIASESRQKPCSCKWSRGHAAGQLWKVRWQGKWYGACSFCAPHLASAILQDTGLYFPDCCGQFDRFDRCLIIAS